MAEQQVYRIINQEREEEQRSGALLATCFCGGLLAALVIGVLLALLGLRGITVPGNTGAVFKMEWLCPRMIIGGLWGLLYFFTVRSARRRWARKGLLIALLPTAFQLFFLFPQRTPHGMLGLGLGYMTPLITLFFNLAWGFLMGFFSRLLWGRE